MVAGRSPVRVTTQTHTHAYAHTHAHTGRARLAPPPSAARTTRRSSMTTLGAGLARTPTRANPAPRPSSWRPGRRLVATRPGDAIATRGGAQTGRQRRQRRQPRRRGVGGGRGTIQPCFPGVLCPPADRLHDHGHLPGRARQRGRARPLSPSLALARAVRRRGIVLDGRSRGRIVRSPSSPPRRATHSQDNNSITITSTSRQIASQI